MTKKFRLSRLSAGVLALVGAVTLSSPLVFAEDKPAIEVVTHAGAGGGTDVNSRMMMLRSRRELKQDMVVVNKRGGGLTASTLTESSLRPKGPPPDRFSASPLLRPSTQKLPDACTLQPTKHRPTASA